MPATPLTRRAVIVPVLLLAAIAALIAVCAALGAHLPLAGTSTHWGTHTWAMGAAARTHMWG